MSTSADRMRELRELAKDGKRIFRLILDEVDVEALLIREGLLDDGVDYDPKAVDAALAIFIEKLCEWPG